MATHVTDDHLRQRAAVERYHELKERAERAPLGSTEFHDAMDELRRHRIRLEVMGVDPVASWRERTRRLLAEAVKSPREGQGTRRRHQLPD